MSVHPPCSLRSAVVSRSIPYLQLKTVRAMKSHSTSDDTEQRTARQRTRKIVSALRREYPDARCTLNYSTPLELLVATILSAQCTDERVNIVTAELFRKYRSCADY